jgi:hypothetical protein
MAGVVARCRQFRVARGHRVTQTGHKIFAQVGAPRQTERSRRFRQTFELELDRRRRRTSSALGPAR